MRRGAVLLLIAAAGLAQEKPEKKPPRPPPPAYVLLLKDTRKLDSETLTKHATAAFGIQFVNAMKDPEKAKEKKAFVMDARPGKVFLIGTPALLFTVETAARPLWKDVPLAARAYAPAREQIVAHKAILTIQARHHGQVERTQAYRDLGKLTLQLLGDDVLALYVPERPVVAVPDKELEKILLAEDPLESLNKNYFSNFVRVPLGDPEMAAAVKKARATFDRFERAFRAGAAANFAVKLKLEDDKTEEFVWISVTKIADGVIHGKLDNNPVNVGKKLGDAVSVKQGEILDWLYVADGKMIGGYSVRVLQKRAQK